VDLTIAASVGVASVRSAAIAKAALIEIAVERLYRAEQGGRHRVVGA
jgi:PleD family two-component response regulator